LWSTSKKKKRHEHQENYRKGRRAKKEVLRATIKQTAPPRERFSPLSNTAVVLIVVMWGLNPALFAACRLVKNWHLATLSDDNKQTLLTVIVVPQQ